MLEKQEGRLVTERKDANTHIGRLLRRFSCKRLDKQDKDLLQCYLDHTTGQLRPQLERSLVPCLAA